MKKLTYFALGILISLLMSASFADESEGDVDDLNNIDHTPIYHVYDDVDLISNMKFFYDKSKVVVKAIFPELKSDTPDEYIDGFNELVQKQVQTTIRDFKEQVKENVTVQKNLPKSAVKNDLFIDYDASVIKSGGDHIISIRFSFQGFVAGMNHPYHYHRVLNYNLATGQQIQLSDLFTPDSNYLNAMAEYARSTLSKHLDNKQMIMEGTEPKADNYKNWNMKPKGLLITFDEYQVAPYVNGSQNVLIPYHVLKDFIAKDSPIKDCAQHFKRCSTHNLLTGGFIDEA